MSAKVTLTKTDAEREAVYQFRYRIYVEEMRRRQIHANHATKRIEEPLDRTGYLFTACDGSSVVGTARLNVGVDENFGDYEDMYNLRVFGPYFPSAISISAKLMVAPEWRRSTLPIKLVMECFLLGTKLGSYFHVLDCNPHLIGFYKKFGFRQVFPNIEHPEYGNVTPLILVNYDTHHLNECGSPFAKVVSPPNDAHQSVKFFYDTICKHAHAIPAQSERGV